MDLSGIRKSPLTRRTVIVGVVISFAAIAATAFFYSRLPEQIPVHWNMNGEIDRYAGRWMAWFFAGLPAFLFVLMSLLPLLDSRRENYLRSSKAYNATVIAIVSVMASLNLIVLFSSLGLPIRVDAVVKGIVGVLFVVIGNYMGTVRSTMLFGIRTPWTLADEGVWRRTHRLGAWLFILAGLIILATMFVRGLWGVILPLAGIGAAVLVPIVFSYIEYRKL